MNLEEFGPDAKDEMSPADYIKFLMDKFYEYRTLAMDPTINDQSTKLYLDKASEYYARAQEAMDEIEPDNTDHLSDEDKALPNKSLADQEAEMNESDNNTEIFTNQHGEKMTMVFNPETGDIKIQHSDIDNKFYPIKQFIDRFVLNNEEKRAIMDFYKSKHKMDEAEDDKLSDEDQAIIDKYEEEEANREVPRDYASMYERFEKLAGINEEYSSTDFDTYKIGDQIELNPKYFAAFEMPDGYVGTVTNINQADYADETPVYTVKLKNIDPFGDEHEDISVEYKQVK
jgi:hypothetical protein